MKAVDRYKKPGGFLQLVMLVETSGIEKREKFLKIIKEENPKWESEIRRKMLTLDKILRWDPAMIKLILLNTPMITLANALFGIPKDRWHLITDNMNTYEIKKLEFVIEVTTPTTSEISSCIVRIIKEVRNLITHGVIKLETIDPELIIPSDYEEKLEAMALQESLESIGGVAPTPPPKAVPEFPINLGPDINSNVTPLESLNSESAVLIKKISDLTIENQNLKAEVSQLRDKFEQIKKLAS
jgi:hypothetical protein